MKNRECPYCHETVSLKRCLKYLLKGTDYDTVCDHCGRSIKLAKEPFPFKYGFLIGFLSMVLPMNLFLYIYHLPFLQSLLYTLPFVIGCIVVIAVITLCRIIFSKDIQ